MIAGGATTQLTLSRLTLINGVVEEAGAAGGCVRAAGAFLNEVNLYDCVARATSGVARGGGIPGTLNADPILQPLQKNGGPTTTLALSPASPAMGAGSNPLSLATDQRLRGHPRKLGLKVDMGAVEYGSPWVRGFER